MGRGSEVKLINPIKNVSVENSRIEIWPVFSTTFFSRIWFKENIIGRKTPDE